MHMRQGLRLPIFEKTRAYITDMLWIPKNAGLHIQPIRDALQYLESTRGGVSVIHQLWDETEEHLIIPREFFKRDTYPNFPFPFVDLRPRNFQPSGIHSKIQIRDKEQQTAWEALLASNGGVLNLAPGKGKTVLALHWAAHLGVPALVVVHNTYLIKQWENEIDAFLELPPGKKIGHIQGKTCDWLQPIVIASITTLANMVEEGRLPVGFSRYFGCGIYDETHHLSAEKFRTTANLVLGPRLGLSANDRREDGLEFIYKYHLGDIFYSDTDMDLTPMVYFQQTPVYIDLKDPDVKDTKGELNIPKLRTKLGNDETSLKFRAWCLKEALDAGRKIFAVGHSKDMIFALAKMFPGCGVITSETPQDERPRIVKESRICFSISQLGVEGLNDIWLDYLGILTPFKHENTGNDLWQALGRIARDPAKLGITNRTKPHPMAVVFEDANVKPFQFMCRTLKKHLQEWGIPYQTLQAPGHWTR